MARPINLQKRISPEQRRQIITMAARGDTNVSIAQVTGCSTQSVAMIKRNNPELLEELKNKIDSYRMQRATEILEKSENLIVRRLNKALEKPEDTLSLGELDRIAKSSYERVRLEQGRATSISASDTNQPIKSSPMDLEKLVEAIKSGDEIKLQSMVFNPRDENG